MLLTPTARLAQVVLPLSAQAETSGTMTSLERRVQRLRRAVPPRGGMETWEILCQLGARMGQRFKMKYASTNDVFAEIQRVVPIYSSIDLDGTSGETIWDLSKLPSIKRPLGAGAFERPRAAGVHAVPRRARAPVRPVVRRVDGDCAEDPPARRHSGGAGGADTVGR